MQALHRQGLILRHEVGNFLHVELLDRLLQVVEQRDENGWNGGDLA
jgi:hypothetical protein